MYETLKFTEMTTRRVIDAKDKDGEKVYVKGHAKATFMSDGRTVEDAINAGGGGGGIAVETDPIFSASPAASITENDKAVWSGKQDAISDLATIRSGAAKGATAVQAETLAGYALEGYVDAEVKALGDSLAEVASSGSYSDLSDKPTFKTINNESILGSGDITISGGTTETYIADFTMEELRQGAYEGVNVECQVQFLIQAMNANKVILVREGTGSAYKGVRVLNGYAEDLLYFSIVDVFGEIIYCDGTDYLNNDSFIEGSSLYKRNFDTKQDTLVSGENIKTINGESIVGSGDITIEGGVNEEYVNNAIANAITNVINANY